VQNVAFSSVSHTQEPASEAVRQEESGEKGPLVRVLPKREPVSRLRETFVRFDSIIKHIKLRVQSVIEHSMKAHVFKLPS